MWWFVFMCVVHYVYYFVVWCLLWLFSTQPEHQKGDRTFQCKPMRKPKKPSIAYRTTTAFSGCVKAGAKTILHIHTQMCDGESIQHVYILLHITDNMIIINIKVKHIQPLVTNEQKCTRMRLYMHTRISIYTYEWSIKQEDIPPGGSQKKKINNHVIFSYDHKYI